MTFIKQCIDNLFSLSDKGFCVTEYIYGYDQSHQDICQNSDHTHNTGGSQRHIGLYILKNIALSNLPVIGKFLAELVRIVENNLGT